MEKVKDKTLPLIYLISMPVIFIVANCIAGLYFKISGIYFEIESANLYVSVLLYPLLYLISGVIIRKTNYKDALRIALVSLISASLVFVIQWGMFDVFNARISVYAFLSFVICQLIFIYTYDFLVKKNKDRYIPIFLLLLVITLIDSILFGALVEGTLSSASMFVRALYLLILPAMLTESVFTMVKVQKTTNKENKVKEKKVAEKKNTSSKKASNKKTTTNKKKDNT